MLGLLLRGTLACHPQATLTIQVADVKTVTIDKFYLDRTHACHLVLTVTGTEEVVVGSARLGQVEARVAAGRCTSGGWQVDCAEVLERSGEEQGDFTLRGLMLGLGGLTVVVVVVICVKGPGQGEGDPAFRRGDFCVRW